MKKIVTTSFAVAALALFASVPAMAQIIIFQDTFDPFISASQGNCTSPGGVAYGYSYGGVSSYTTAVNQTVGVGGTAGLNIVDNNIASGGSGGVALKYQEQTLSGNTDPTLADYTLSFDAAASNTGASDVPTMKIEMQGYLLNNFGGGSSGDISTMSDVHFTAIDGSYYHYSLNLATAFAGTPLNPESGTIQFFFQLNSHTAATYTDTINLDNVTLTMVPEPTTLALAGLGAAALLVFRRRNA
jgi:hypothetical protein